MIKYRNKIIKTLIVLFMFYNMVFAYDNVLIKTDDFDKQEELIPVLNTLSHNPAFFSFIDLSNKSIYSTCLVSKDMNQ